MDINIDLLLSLDDKSLNKIRSALVKELSDNIFILLKKQKTFIKNFAVNKVKKYLLDSPEVNDLLDENGRLKVELGIKSSTNDVYNLVNFIAESLVIDFDKNNKDINAIVNLEIKSNKQLADLYLEPFSHYITEKGVKIEWLKWLIEAGDSDVIFGYKIRYGVDIGRTGEAIMIKSKHANWRVPPEFSGTIDNNFITRSLSNLEKDLSEYIENILS